MSGYYGMAADHVMALEVVTASGEYVTASPTNNTDLYWALRGGGGGTYGIVTSLIVRVHPKMPAVTSTFTFSTSEKLSNERFWAAVRKYLAMFIPFTDAHTYSFFWVYNTNGTYTFDMKPFFAPNYTIESFNALVKPWFDEMKALGVEFTPDTQFHENFYSAYSATWQQNAGLNSAGGVVSLPGNRLFPRSVWESEEKFSKLITSLRTLSESGQRWGGYHQAPQNRANADNAVSPAWRNVIAFFISSATVSPDATSEEMSTASRRLTYDILGPWREIAPHTEGGGSYLNEANVMEPEWQADFYGEEIYQRLLGIKKKWDPRGVFYATTAVGSEDWEVRDGIAGVQTQNGRLCRV